MYVWVLEKNLRSQDVCPGIKFRVWQQAPILMGEIVLFILNFVYAYVCICAMCVQYLRRPEEGVRSSKTGFTGGCEPLLNLREQK